MEDHRRDLKKIPAWTDISIKKAPKKSLQMAERLPILTRKNKEVEITSSGGGKKGTEEGRGGSAGIPEGFLQGG